MPFDLLAHTADVRAAVSAPDRPALYQAAVDLVRTLVVGDSPVAARETRLVPPDGADEAERFFRFVRELLFLVDAEGFVPQAVTGMEPPAVAGERYDPARHTSEHQLKALTRHGYEFRQAAAGYRAEMVFDL